MAVVAPRMRASVSSPRLRKVTDSPAEISDRLYATAAQALPPAAALAHVARLCARSFLRISPAVHVSRWRAARFSITRSPTGKCYAQKLRAAELGAAEVTTLRHRREAAVSNNLTVDDDATAGTGVSKFRKVGPEKPETSTMANQLASYLS